MYLNLANMHSKRCSLGFPCHACHASTTVVCMQLSVVEGKELSGDWRVVAHKSKPWQDLQLLHVPPFPPKRSLNHQSFSLPLRPLVAGLLFCSSLFSPLLSLSLSIPLQISWLLADRSICHSLLGSVINVTIVTPPFRYRTPMSPQEAVKPAASFIIFLPDTLLL